MGEELTADDSDMGPKISPAEFEDLNSTVYANTTVSYDRIERSVKSSSRVVDREGLWTLGTSVRLPQVVHMMIVEPGSRRLQLWLRGPDEAADSTRAPVVHEWDAVFAAG